jgi:hypothetical protein
MLATSGAAVKGYYQVRLWISLSPFKELAKQCLMLHGIRSILYPLFTQESLKLDLIGFT